MSRASKLVIAGVIVTALGGGVAWATSGGSPPSPAPATADGRPARAPDREHGIWRHGLLGHLSSAELTVVIGGTEHRIRIDRGTIQSVSPTAVVLKELDGSMVTIRVSGDTRVVVDGLEASISDVREGYVGIAIRDGESPARALRASDHSEWAERTVGTDALTGGG